MHSTQTVRAWLIVAGGKALEMVQLANELFRLDARGELRGTHWPFDRDVIQHLISTATAVFPEWGSSRIPNPGTDDRFVL